MSQTINEQLSEPDLIKLQAAAGWWHEACLLSSVAKSLQERAAVPPCADRHEPRCCSLHLERKRLHPRELAPSPFKGLACSMPTGTARNMRTYKHCSVLGACPLPLLLVYGEPRTSQPSMCMTVSPSLASSFRLGTRHQVVVGLFRIVSCLLRRVWPIAEARAASLGGSCSGDASSSSMAIRKSFNSPLKKKARVPTGNSQSEEPPQRT